MGIAELNKFIESMKIPQTTAININSMAVDMYNVLFIMASRIKGNDSEKVSNEVKKTLNRYPDVKIYLCWDCPHRSAGKVTRAAGNPSLRPDFKGCLAYFKDYTNIVSEREGECLASKLDVDVVWSRDTDCYLYGAKFVGNPEHYGNTFVGYSTEDIYNKLGNGDLFYGRNILLQYAMLCGTDFTKPISRSNGKNVLNLSNNLQQLVCGNVESYNTLINEFFSPCMAYILPTELRPIGYVAKFSAAFDRDDPFERPYTNNTDLLVIDANKNSLTTEQTEDYLLAIELSKNRYRSLEQINNIYQNTTIKFISRSKTNKTMTFNLGIFEYTNGLVTLSENEYYVLRKDSLPEYFKFDVLKFDDRTYFSILNMYNNCKTFKHYANI